MRARTRRLKSLSRVTAVTSSADRRPPPSDGRSAEETTAAARECAPLCLGWDSDRGGAVEVGRRPAPPSQSVAGARRPSSTPLRYGAEVTSPNGNRRVLARMGPGVPGGDQQESRVPAGRQGLEVDGGAGGGG